LNCSGNPWGVACGIVLNESWGRQGMAYWSITSGAQDLNYLVKTLGGPGPHYIQGDSFGTAWGQRTVAMFPNLFNAGAFESFLVPNLWNFFDAPSNIDQIVRGVLGYCRKDLWCLSHTGMGSDPEVKFARFYNLDITTTACFPYLSNVVYPIEIPWRQLFQQMMSVFFSGDRNALALIPVAVRIFLSFSSDNDLIRCTNTANFILNWWKFYNQTTSFSSFRSLRAPVDPCDISNPLLYNLFLSEGASNPPTIPTLYDELFSSLGSPPIDILYEGIDLAQVWPVYSTPYNNAIPRTKMPLFYFNGDLDASTPVANVAVYALEMTNYTFRILPMVNHVGFLSSPVVGSILPCGLDMITKFFMSKGMVVDDSCIKNLVPLDFQLMSNSTKILAAQYFGTPNPWVFL